MSKNLKVEVGELYRIANLSIASYLKSVNDPRDWGILGRSAVETAFAFDTSKVYLDRFRHHIVEQSVKEGGVVGVATKVVPVPIGNGKQNIHMDYVELLTDRYGIVYVSCEYLESMTESTNGW